MELQKYNKIKYTPFIKSGKIINYKSLFHLVFFLEKYRLIKVSFTVNFYYNKLVPEAISSQNVNIFN